MDKKAEVEILLRGYEERRAKIQLLEIERNALCVLDPAPHAVDISHITAHVNAKVSTVEAEILRRENLPERLKELDSKIIYLRLINQKIDIIISCLPDVEGQILKYRYIERMSWVKVAQYCPGYSVDYVRGTIKEKALAAFADFYFEK